MQESMLSKLLKMNRFLVLFLLCLCGCYHASDDTLPKLSIAVQDRYLQQLPSAFKPLTLQEKSQDWGKEYQVGLGFAHELDLYQAMTAFKRASFLIPPQETERKLELSYSILLCYYLAGKYGEVAYTYEHSDLRYVNGTFPAYQDMQIILYDTYLRLDQTNKSDRLLQTMASSDPATEEKLSLSGTLVQRDIPTLRAVYGNNPDIAQLLHTYDAHKKSVGTAQALNAFIPGSGYLYLGQTQSAVTAFLLNGLFIWSSVYCFQKGNVAAGAILASFEAGWYFGGIYGAGQEAKFYNERVYESIASPMMNEKRLFPILMLHYAF